MMLSREFRAAIFIACLVGATAPRADAQLCGDCNGDMVVNIMDSLRAAQHAVLISTLPDSPFQICNVAGDPGPPYAPGNPSVDALDALLIAQWSVGLVPPLACTMAPVISAGPYDVRFGTMPTTVASGQPFEVPVFLYVQGSAQLAIPTTPLLVTLARQTGTGTLGGSVRQYMTSETQIFGNLRYGPIENFSLFATAGAPHGTDISSLISNVIAVEADVKGGVVSGAGPYPAVRFNFVANGFLAPVTGNFDWTITRMSTMAVIASGTIPLAAVNRADVPVASLPADGLYRVFGEIRGTIANDVYPLVRAASMDEERPTMASGRVGVPYNVNLTLYTNQASGSAGWVPPTIGPFTSVLGLAEELPPGLVLNPGAAGNISGTPTRPGFYEFTLFGISAANRASRLVVHIAVFSFRDTEVETGLSFSNLGPHATSEFDSTYNFTNWWDCSTDTTTARFYFPTNAANMRRLPAVTFLHGNGFRYDFYNDLFRLIASYGYVVGSMDNPGFPQDGCTFCSTAGSGGPGYSRAVGFQDSVVQKFRELNAGTMPGAPGSATALIGKLDFDNLFYSGHSRGGSTTICNMYWKPYLARGTIPSMQVEPTQQSCLSILSNVFPRLPMLTFYAENDGDVVFPLAEAVIDDKVARGMTTGVTLYGACHGQFADTALGGCASVAETAVRARVKDLNEHLFTGFLERHSRGDLRTEGFLYLGEYQSHDELGLYGQRDMAGTVHFDDHQDAPAGTNLTTGPNTQVTITISETNTYPNAYGRPIKHRRLGFGSGAGSNTWSAPAGVPEDTTGMVWLTFRARQYNCVSTACLGSVQWSWLTTFNVILTDGAGVTSTFNLVPLFPPTSALAFHQRFTRFSLPLATFAASSPGFNPNSIQSVRFACGPAGTSGNFFAADDVRFE